jgi:DNA-binding NarL/FixJ family response regulator
MAFSFDDPVLVLDDMPLIAHGLQEVLRTLHPSIVVEYAESVFHVLSAPAWQGRSFSVIVLGSAEDRSPGGLLLPAADLKAKFPDSRIVIFTDRYDPAVIAKTGQGTIDACLHKYEGPVEVRSAWIRLAAGEPYLSPLMQSLYNDYRLDR